jgi:hypothetical protein
VKEDTTLPEEGRRVGPLAGTAGASSKPQPKLRSPFLELEDGEPSAAEPKTRPPALGAVSDAEPTADDPTSTAMAALPTTSTIGELEAAARQRSAIGTNRRSNHTKLLKKNFKPIGIDTEAINELYTYGGEQGQKKASQENELMDFENGILELASQCLAAMKREKPTDPIVYDDPEQSVKRSFEQRFQIAGDEEGAEEGGAGKQAEADEQPNYFRPNFNVPQTMRGIKNLALSVGGLKSATKHAKPKIETTAFTDFDIEENEAEDDENDELGLQTRAKPTEGQQRSELVEEAADSDAPVQPIKPKNKLQIIDYDIIQDQDDANQAEAEQVGHQLAPLRMDKSQSQ